MSNRFSWRFFSPVPRTEFPSLGAPRSRDRSKNRRCPPVGARTSSRTRTVSNPPRISTARSPLIERHDSLVRRDFQRLNGSRGGIDRRIPRIDLGIDERVPIGQPLGHLYRLEQVVRHVRGRKLPNSGPASVVRQAECRLCCALQFQGILPSCDDLPDVEQVAMPTMPAGLHAPKFWLRRCCSAAQAIVFRRLRRLAEMARFSRRTASGELFRATGSTPSGRRGDARCARPWTIRCR